MAVLPLMVFLGHILTSKSDYTDIYNFPMFGVLMHGREDKSDKDKKTAYGSVTIVKDRVALCATENLFQLTPDGKGWIPNDPSGKRVHVFLGTDLLHPPDDYEKTKVEIFNVDKIFFAKDSKWVADVEKKSLDKIWNLVKKYNPIVGNPFDKLKEINEESLRKDGWVFNPFQELQWDIAILILDRKVVWTPYVLPAPFTWKHWPLYDSFLRDWKHIETLERTPHEFPPCTVPGWSPIGNNEVIFHKVVYIRYRQCAEAICGAYPSTCLRYLNNRHHVCFKSLSFADSCVIDQGAPVLCSWFPQKIVGILTKTFQCGTETLPSVFTRIDIIGVFATIAKVPDVYGEGTAPELNDPLYTEQRNI